MPPPEGHFIKYQFNNSHFKGPVTFDNRTVYYQESKQLPRRLTALPSLQSKVIGRDLDLKRLTQKLKETGTTAIVRGMGGVGKTTLATAYLAQEQATLAHIVWITQTGDFATSLLSGGTSGQARLSELLGVEITDDPNADAQRLLIELSGLSGPSLLVIDNAEIDVNNYLEYLPGSPSWSVILTTRETLKVSSQLELDNLDEDDAMALFQEHHPVGGHEEQDTIRALVNDVEGHALTIELLAKTAAARHLPLAKFYHQLRERGLAIGRRADDVTIAHDRDGKLQKVFPYLLAVFDLSELTDAARQLLYQLTIFPASFTSFDLLAQLLGQDPDKEEEWDNFTSILKTLEDTGWLQTDLKRGCRLHRVVAEVVRQHPNYSYASKVLDEVLARINDYISYDQHSNTNPALMVEELAFGDGVLKMLTARETETLTGSHFYDRLVALQQVFGRYQQAAQLLEKALQFSLIHYGEDHLNVQASRSNLAIAYQDLGRYQEAVQLLKKALQFSLAHYGEEHPSVQIHRSKLAIIYRDLGRYQEAAQLLEKALQFELAQSGEEDPAVQISRSILATVYKNLGRYKEAAQLLEKALQFSLTHYGEKHPNVQTNRSDLALVYRDLGRYQEAAQLLTKALQLELVYYGEEHPTVQIRRSNLALIYQDLGHYEEAAELLTKALHFELEHYGEEHPSVQTSRSNLALVYQGLGRYQEGAELLKKALQFDIAHSGEEHPKVQISRSNLALAYKNLGRYQEAAGLLEKTLQFNLGHYGEKYPGVQVNRSNLALLYQNLGRRQEATKLLEIALHFNLDHYDDGHPDVQTARSNLATLYEELGRHQEAAQLLTKALQFNLAHYGEEHPNVQINRSNLAIAYHNLGRHNEAIELLEKALQSDLENYGKNHPDVQNSKINLGVIYCRTNQMEKGYPLLLSAQQHLQSQLGPEHPHTKFANNIIAEIKDHSAKKQ